MSAIAGAAEIPLKPDRIPPAPKVSGSCQEETHALQQFWLLDHFIVRAIVVPSVRAPMIFARPLDGTLSDRAILLTENRHEPISLLLS
jgi:hypothetical protein